VPTRVAVLALKAFSRTRGRGTAYGKITGRAIRTPWTSALTSGHGDTRARDSRAKFYAGNGRLSRSAARIQVRALSAPTRVAVPASWAFSPYP
jgi:hypothetical protein